MQDRTAQFAALNAEINARFSVKPVDWSREAKRHADLAQANLKRLQDHRRWLAEASARDPQVAPLYRQTRAEIEAALAAAKRHRELARSCAERAAAQAQQEAA